MVRINFIISALQKWIKYPFFYFMTGLIFMAMVIAIARTSLFVLCYLPLIVSSVWIARPDFKSKSVWYPSVWLRTLMFSLGIVVSELIFCVILLFQGELNGSAESWMVIAIELALSLVVFWLFFGIASVVRYFSMKASSKSIG